MMYIVCCIPSSIAYSVFFMYSVQCTQNSLQNNLDSTCVLIGLQECFHSSMKHENDVSNMVDCLRVVRIYSTRFVYRLVLC